MKDDGKLTKMMRIGAWVIGIPCLYGSAKLSVSGVNLDGDLWWMGWVIAAALTFTQFLVNGSYEKELNWTILVLGISSYVASIGMNIFGLYQYRFDVTGVDFWYVVDNFDFGTLALGVFIDAFPEMALRWSLGESRVGDWIGNMVKTAQNPEILTKSFTVPSVGNHEPRPHGQGSRRREELQRQFNKPSATKRDARNFRDMDEDEKPVRRGYAVR